MPAVPASPRSILVVDDSAETQQLVMDALRDDGWHVTAVPTLAAAETMVACSRVEVVITGLHSLPADDARTLRRLRRRHPHLKMIVLAAQSEPADVIAALREHAFSYFSSPFSPADIRAAVEHALREPAWDDGIEVVSDSPDWLTIRARCQMLTADRVLRFVDEIAPSMPDEERSAIGSALREILLNAVEHGGQFDPRLTVEVTCIRTPGLLMYLIRDPGPGFDPGALPHAAVSHPEDPMVHVTYRDSHGIRAGGFGLLMARGLVDELKHNAAGNEALLIKYLGSR